MRIFQAAIILFVVTGFLFCAPPFCLAGGPSTIVFLTWKPNQPEIWQSLIETFHRTHPGIRVRVQVAPHSSTEYHAIISQRLKNRDPSVDVFFMDVIWPPEFANAGWALDLTPRFSKAAQQPFLPGPVAANTYQGKIYGVPCYLAAGIFYYRKDLLEKYDFSRPRTWQEMLSQGETIIHGEGDRTLHVYSGQFKQYEGLVCGMLEFIRSFGGEVLEVPGGRSLLSEMPAVRAVTFVRDELIGKAAPKGVINYEEPESLYLFMQGKAIFHRNWPYAWALINDPEKSEIAGKAGVGCLPGEPGYAGASTLGGWQFGINRWSGNSDQAWQFIRFMTSHRAQKALALEAGLVPTRRSVYQDPEVQQKMPHLNALLPVFEKARPRPLSPVYPMISQELQRFFSHAIVDGTSDIPALAGQTGARIERLFKLGTVLQP